MQRRYPAVLGLVLIAGLGTACSDTTSPTNAALPMAFASGSGGGGGGGTSGGGGGTTTTAGRISPASGGATCDAGTSIGIGLDRGNQNRIQVSLGFVAAPTVGPNGETSLGGFWNVRLTDENGNGIGGVGSNVGSTTPSMSWTFLGGTVTPGAHTITFSATNTYLAPGTAFPAADAPLLETCTASIPVFAR